MFDVVKDVEVLNDTEDSRCLKVTVHGRTSNMKSSPVLQATFIFDDHIRFNKQFKMFF